LIDRRWYSSVLDVRPFRGADADALHYMVVAKVKEILAVISKQNGSLMWRALISGR
jgi:hypothetical protein